MPACCVDTGYHDCFCPREARDEHINIHQRRAHAGHMSTFEQAAAYYPSLFLVHEGLKAARARLLYQSASSAPVLLDRSCTQKMGAFREVHISYGRHGCGIAFAVAAFGRNLSQRKAAGEVATSTAARGRNPQNELVPGKVQESRFQIILVLVSKFCEEDI